MSRIVSWVMLTLLLVGAFALAFNVGLVHAQYETVYINSDGSVSPSSTPISTVDNFTYRLVAPRPGSLPVRQRSCASFPFLQRARAPAIR